MLLTIDANKQIIMDHDWNHKNLIWLIFLLRFEIKLCIILTDYGTNLICINCFPIKNIFIIDAVVR